MARTPAPTNPGDASEAGPFSWLANLRATRLRARAEQRAQSHLALGTELMNAIAADDLARARSAMDRHRDKAGADDLEWALDHLEVGKPDSTEGSSLMSHCAQLGKFNFCSELALRGARADIDRALALAARACVLPDSGTFGRVAPHTFQAALVLAGRCGADPLAESGTPLGSALAEAYGCGAT